MGANNNDNTVSISTACLVSLKNNLGVQMQKHIILVHPMVCNTNKLDVYSFSKPQG